MIKVILVEDEELLRRKLNLTTPWEDLGCELAGQAENGISGLDLIRKVLPDLIITDIRMPGMDGLKMLETLHSEGSPEYFPAVLILTGHGDFDYTQKAIRLGVKDYLLKPIDDGEFFSSIKRITAEINSDRNPLSRKTPTGFADGQEYFFREYQLPGNTDSRDNYAFAAVMFIRDHFSRDISISEAAGFLKITDSYLSRLFKQKTNLTFLEYLTNYRIKMDIEFMKQENLRVYEIAQKSGFRDAGYFSQIFRRYTGVSPARYKSGCMDSQRLNSI